MTFEIITPEGKLFSGNVELVTVPGTKGPFTILSNHAPIISSLGAGVITYRHKNEDKTLSIDEGFVEVLNNHISAVVEITNE